MPADDELAAALRAAQAGDATGFATLSPYFVSGIKAALGSAATTLSVSPASVIAGSTGNAVTLTGGGTAWTPGSPGRPSVRGSRARSSPPGAGPARR